MSSTEFKYLKDPVDEIIELYQRYPDGGEKGWFAYCTSLKNFVAWDVTTESWLENKSTSVANKVDKEDIVQVAGDDPSKVLSQEAATLLFEGKEDVSNKKQIINDSETEYPSSKAVKDALAGKVSSHSPAFTGNPTGLTKASVGLSNVNNTSDENKPVSLLTRLELEKLIPKTAVKQTTGSSQTDLMSQKAVLDYGNTKLSILSQTLTEAQKLQVRNNADLQSKLVFNVKDFGAVGDGINDDTQSFMNTFNICNQGDTIYIPQGVYILDKLDIFINKNINIIGTTESIIKINQKLRFRNISITFKNIIFDLNGQLIDITPYSSDLTFLDNKYFCSIIQNATFDNCKFISSSFVLIAGWFNNYIIFNKCEFIKVGITAMNCDNLLIDNCIFDAQYSNNVNDEIIVAYPFTSGIIQNSTIKNSYIDAIDLYQAKKFIVKNNIFDGCYTAFITIKGGYRNIEDPYFWTATNCIGAPEFILIEGNYFKNLKNAPGITTQKTFIEGGFEDDTDGSIDLTPYYRNSIQIINNTFDDNYIDILTPSSVVALFIYGLHGLTVINNTFKPSINSSFLYTYSSEITDNSIIKDNKIIPYLNGDNTLIASVNLRDSIISNNQIIGKGTVLYIPTFSTSNNCTGLIFDNNTVKIKGTLGHFNLTGGTDHSIKIINSIIDTLVINVINCNIEINHCTVIGWMQIKANTLEFKILNSLLSVVDYYNFRIFAGNTLSLFVLFNCYLNKKGFLKNDGTITKYLQSGNITDTTNGYVWEGVKPTTVAINDNLF